MVWLIKGIDKNYSKIENTDFFENNEDLMNIISRKFNLDENSFNLFSGGKILNPREKIECQKDLNFVEVRFKLLGGKVIYLFLF